MLESEELKSHFTKRYVVAIGIIAVLSSITFFTLHFAFKLSDSTALIVNIAGKQRMLSQRIASLSLHYQIHLYNAQKPDIQKIRFDLEEMIVQMESANENLSSGHLNSGVILELSPAIREIYFGDMALKNRVDEYLRLANQVLHEDKPEKLYVLTHHLALQAESLLPDLNEAVLQYQKEGEEHLALVKSIETAAFLLTLLTLMLEVIFIFQPMAHKLQELFRELKWNQEHLENEIEKRTLSLEQSNYRLQQLASHDPLTGLKNRLNLEHDLENLIDHYQQHRVAFAVALVDIDWFKKINDTYGHEIGDSVLKDLSQLILSHVRSEDSAYRVGGEEFVIIFNRIEEYVVVEKIEILRQLVENHLFQYGDLTIKVTISGGVYHPKWAKADTVQLILKYADDALYEAKRSGRNKIITVKGNLIGAANPDFLAKMVISAQLDKPFKILYADFDIIDLLGYSNDVLIKGDMGWDELLYLDNIDFLEKLEQKEPFMTTCRIRHGLGYIKILKFECTPCEESWRIEIQDPILLAKSVEDRMIVENFDAMMNNSDDFIYFKDRFHVFTGASKTLVRLTNVLKKEDLIGKTDYEVFPTEFADHYFKLEKEVFSGDIEVAQEIQPYLDNSGHAGWVDNRKYPIKNSNGEIIGLFGIARIVLESTELKRIKSD